VALVAAGLVVILLTLEEVEAVAAQASPLTA
jgi:hypothetical protein